MHQGAEPITRPLQGHHQTEKYDQAARVKIALTDEVLDYMRDRAVSGAQSFLHHFISSNLRPT
jgi:hypothetical protein